FVLVEEGEKLGPKAQGEGVHLDSAEAPDDEVAVFVNEHHDAQHDDERHDVAGSRQNIVHRLELPRTLDHAAFARNRADAENVIDSQKIERASSEKPVLTF